MELKEFISRSLVDIIEGVTMAQAATLEHAKAGGMGSIHPIGPAINPKMFSGDDSAVKIVDFDVAVTVTEGISSEVEGKAGISVIGLNAQLQQESSHSKVSRIKFQVPIRFAYLNG
jgi:hypothetical protein